MEKIYIPRNIEQPLYEHWEKNGYFKPNGDKNKESFCIMLPPPNITGDLHMGHAFQQTIMDIIVRYQRMLGKNTLWQSGIDHAGIATQIIVERKIADQEGKTRYDYGRDAFINKVWKWKAESGNMIFHQMRRLGNSIDWDRKRFTMDEGFSNAVKEVFIRLYKENIIYRSKRLVNWDPKLCTAISDLEIEKHEIKGSIWYICYPLADNVKTIDGKNYLVVSTTRPETLLGDTGVAVNPLDSRYNNLIGKFVILPLVNRRIPIIGDKYVRMEKESGCVKITPAHDFIDYEVGRRHQLPMINILTFDGNIRESAEVFDAQGNKSNFYSTKIPIKFQKLDRFVARKMIISSVKSLGLLEAIRPHDLTVPYGDRGGVIIEPILTDQWYVRTNILLGPAIDAVKNGDIQFIPKKYEKMYFSWMENIQDWCISRQLWWGHRIPAWYDQKGHVYVGFNEEKVREENNLSTDVILYQDNDVLDTWFSSSLWTFSTLGWPKNTEALHQFHPTKVIVSGFDIIFFWIARMIMMTMHFIKNEDGKSQVPFRIVYITGLIRDDKGQKMSKSKGNVIDPLDMIDGISLEELLKKRTCNMIHPQIANKIRESTEKYFPNGIKSYGTDALRFTLASLASTSRDINWDMKRLEGYRNFCNKIWNASRFVLMNTKHKDCGFNGEEKFFSIADRWILTVFNKAIKMYRNALDGFRFDIATEILYEFIWDQFCNWYLEFTKSVINNGSEPKLLRGTRYTLITILEATLRLAHPIIPFITEAIWQKIKILAKINADTIMLQPFPSFNVSSVDKVAFDDIEWLKQVIVAVRSLLSGMNIPVNKPFDLLLRSCSSIAIRRINENKKFLQSIMIYLKSITILPSGDTGPISSIKVIDGAEILIPVPEIKYKSIELKFLEKKIMKLDMKISRIKKKLVDKDFISYAPKLIISKEYKKLLECIAMKKKLIEQQKTISIQQ